MSILQGLYIVATPIGNLEDFSVRGIETLKNVDRIAAEDTRHSQKLLKHFDIITPLISLHDHNESASSKILLDCLKKNPQKLVLLGMQKMVLKLIISSMHLILQILF